MKEALKSFVPLGLRTRLKWAAYALHDLADPIKTPRVPKRRETFVGGGDFVAVGNAFLEKLKQRGLTSDQFVLDVGCGQGRMARPLADYLSPKGRYLGFDIVREGVDWCEQHYKDLPNFSFHHANVFNARYNPEGDVRADAYRFPIEEAQADLAFLTSVFTHMFQKDVAHYMSELSRALKPGGTVLITWFLLNEESRRAEAPRMNFQHELDEVSRTTLTENPEAAIAFDEAFVRQLYLQHGFEIEAIEYGSWSRPNSPRDLQDLVIARKA